MPNDEHVAMLKKGVDAWNAWRRDLYNLNIDPDLSKADLIEANPKELEAIVPALAVPVQPLLEGASRPYAMFKDYWKYEWVLPVYRYADRWTWRWTWRTRSRRRTVWRKC